MCACIVCGVCICICEHVWSVYVACDTCVWCMCVWCMRKVCVWFVVCIWCVCMHMCMCVVCVHICVLKEHINAGDRVAQWLP